MSAKGVEVSVLRTAKDQNAGKHGPLVATEDCPCEGKRGYTWHLDKKVPHCEHSRETRNTYRRNKQLGWQVGSPIEVPEIDPL